MLPKLPSNSLTIGALVLAAIIMILGYFHIIDNKAVETMADEYIKAKTGIDIPLSEEKPAS